MVTWNGKYDMMISWSWIGINLIGEGEISSGDNSDDGSTKVPPMSTGMMVMVASDY